MNGLDFIIAIPLMYFIYRGFSNGIVREILNIIGIGLGILFTFKYLDLLSSLISPMFQPDSPFIPFVSGIIIFSVTLIVVTIFASIIKKLLGFLQLGWINRVLGILFGTVKSLMIIGMALFLLSGLNLPPKELRDGSYLYKYVIYAGPVTYKAVANLIPGSEDFIINLENKLSKYNKADDLPFLNEKE